MAVEGRAPVKYSSVVDELVPVLNTRDNIRTGKLKSYYPSIYTIVVINKETSVSNYILLISVNSVKFLSRCLRAKVPCFSPVCIDYIMQYQYQYKMC